MFLIRRSSLIVAIQWFGALTLQSTADRFADVFGDAVADDRSAPRGRTKAAAGVPRSAERVLHRRRQRRRVEDDRLRAHLEADLRRSAHRLDRRARGGAVQPERHLRRQRRRAAAAGPLDRRRDVQVHRRRQDVDAPRPARRPADPADRRRSARSRTGCSSPCSAIPTGPTRSAASSARPTAARRFRRSSTRTRTPAASTSCSIPTNPRHRLRRALGGATGAVGERRVHRAGQRAVQVHRWRRRRGRSCERAADFEQDGSAASASPSRRASRAASTRPSKRDAEGGLYRTDDAGENWIARPPTARVGRATPISPRSRSIRRTRTSCYTANVVTWKSTDGGKTFKAFRGAPGGDDYQRIWINPNNPDIILIAATRARSSRSTAARRGARGTTSRPRSSITSRPTTRFPYRVCGGQQESGSACVASRGDDGRITFATGVRSASRSTATSRRIRSNPDIVYGGKVTRFDRRTGEVQQVGPRVGRGGAARATTARCAPRRSCSRRRSAHAVLRVERRVEDDQRRQELDADQPRPDAPDWTCRRASASTRHAGGAQPTRAAWSTRSRRRTSTSTRSGPAPTTG